MSSRVQSDRSPLSCLGPIPSPYKLTSLLSLLINTLKPQFPPSMPWAARLTETSLPQCSPQDAGSGRFSSLEPEVKVTSARRASGAPKEVGPPHCQSHPIPWLLSQHRLSSVLESMISLPVECLLQEGKAITSFKRVNYGLILNTPNYSFTTSKASKVVCLKWIYF